MRIPCVFVTCVGFVAAALLAIPATASAEDGITPAARHAAVFTTPRDANEGAAYVETANDGTITRRRNVVDPYHATVPMGETRSAWTAPAVPPTPFALIAGEGMTPVNGRLALNITRISDERFLIDGASRRWDSDGEVRIISFEAVSPRYVANLGAMRVPFHLSGSIHAYTLNHGIFERIRNLVEEELLSATQTVIDNHDIGGKELSIDGEDLLGSAPMWKLRLGVKVPLPTTQLFGCRLFTSVSAGLTLPAFGHKSDAGNEDVQPDLTFAYTLPISRRWWFSGAFALSFPGSTPRFDELGLETSDVLFSGMANIEYWINDCWGAAAGFQFQTNYLENSDIAMDESSTYFNLAILWRPAPCHMVHLTWSENPDTDIAFGAARDFDNSQKDADFTFLLGWRYQL